MSNILPINDSFTTQMSENQQEKFANRLKEIISKKRLSTRTVAEAISKSQSTVSKAINNNIDPGVSFILSLSSVIPDCNYDWLITGRGNMILDNEGLNEAESDNTHKGKTHHDSIELYKELVDHANSEIKILKKLVKVLEQENEALKGGRSSA